MNVKKKLELNPYSNLALSHTMREWQLRMGRLVLDTRPADECTVLEGKDAFEDMIEDLPEDTREAFEILQARRREVLGN